MLKNHARSSFAALIVLALAAVVPGCGGASVDSICQDACDCVKCPAKELASCKSQLQDLEKLADNANCSSEFDDSLNCLSDHLSCSSGLDNKSCSSQQDKLNACFNKTN